MKIAAGSDQSVKHMGQDLNGGSPSSPLNSSKAPLRHQIVPHYCICLFASLAWLTLVLFLAMPEDVMSLDSQKILLSFISNRNLYYISIPLLLATDVFLAFILDHRTVKAYFRRSFFVANSASVLIYVFTFVLFSKRETGLQRWVTGVNDEVRYWDVVYLFALFDLGVDESSK